MTDYGNLTECDLGWTDNGDFRFPPDGDCNVSTAMIMVGYWSGAVLNGLSFLLCALLHARKIGSRKLKPTRKELLVIGLFSFSSLLLGSCLVLKINDPFDSAYYFGVNSFLGFLLVVGVIFFLAGVWTWFSIYIEYIKKTAKGCSPNRTEDEYGQVKSLVVLAYIGCGILLVSMVQLYLFTGENMESNYVICAACFAGSLTMDLIMWRRLCHEFDRDLTILSKGSGGSNAPSGELADRVTLARRKLFMITIAFHGMVFCAIPYTVMIIAVPSTRFLIAYQHSFIAFCLPPGLMLIMLTSLAGNEKRLRRQYTTIIVPSTQKDEK